MLFLATFFPTWEGGAGAYDFVGVSSALGRWGGRASEVAFCLFEQDQRLGAEKVGSFVFFLIGEILHMRAAYKPANSPGGDCVYVKREIDRQRI